MKIPSLALALLSPLLPLPPQESLHAQETVELDGLGLRLDFSDFEEIDGRTFGGGQLRGAWTGSLGGAQVVLDVLAFDAKDWGFREPGGVANEVVGFLRDDGDLTVDGSGYHEGPYGHAEYLSVVTGPLVEGDEVTGRQFVAAGLLPDHGYALHARVRPETEEAVKAFQDFLTEGIRYDGEVRDVEWTLDELRARWQADTPPEMHADFLKNLSKKAWVKKAVLRTDHYVILTNASGGKNFARKLEENYREIAKIFPFEDSEAMRLMPVFLFRDVEDYNDFCVKMGMSRGNAGRSAGHAWKDYYATMYRSPNDPVHIHEQTHQLFANRLFLNGGGSWFQEGVAEYVESSENDRNVIARDVKRGRHTPLAEFFALRSLLFQDEEAVSDDTSQAADHYKQAALLIEFLRDGKWGAGKFDRFLTTVGHTRRNDIPAIRQAFLDIYGVTIEGLDQAFQDYCKKR